MYACVGSLLGQGKGSKWRALAAGASLAISLCAVAGNADAGSPTEPGVTLGFPTGSPVPEGVYFLNSLSFGNDRFNSASNLDIEVPVIFWASPYSVLGGQLRMEASVPSLAFNDYGNHPIAVALGNNAALTGGAVKNATFQVYQIAEEYQNFSIAWKLGGGWNISQAFGLYTPGPFNGQSFIPEGRTAITFLTHEWMFTTNFIYGGGVSRVDGNGSPWNDYVNVDISLVRTLGKWELGAVSFITADTSISGTTKNGPCDQLVSAYFNGFSGNTCTGKQERVAVGGLIGYKWGPVTTELFVTHDVVDHNVGGAITPTPGIGITAISGSKPTDGISDTRVWTTLKVPLWVNEQHEPLK
jgi:hypothetical protein